LTSATSADFLVENMDFKVDRPKNPSPLFFVFSSKDRTLKLNPYFEGHSMSRSPLLLASFASVLLVFSSVSLCSQDTSVQPNSGNAPQAQPQDQSIAPGQTPVFRVTVTERTTHAVNYRNRGGSTTVDMQGTALSPAITGKAKVDGKAGRLAIDVELNHIEPALKFGGQYLTYVLWAITPEARAVNLGEVLPGENGKDKLSVTTDLQAFGLIVTAEPYFAVIHPSDKVVAENIVLHETKGFEETISAKFDVLEGSEYVIDIPADKLPSAQAGPRVPLDLLEARNAVMIAKSAGAEQYAKDTISQAEDMLGRAEDYYQRKQGRTPIGTAARGAVQQAEDARVLTLRRIEKEKEDAAAAAEAAARAKAEADAEAARQGQLAAQAQSDQDARRRAEAEAAQAKAEAQQAAALQQQQAAQAQAAAAAAAAAEADRQRQDAIRQKEEMRARLLAQLNQVLQTRDTPRGLVVSMPDVLFDFNKFALKPEARERLARISGIVLAYPDLMLAIEGYTDSIGTDEYNQTLSEKRAQTVQAYLTGSGVAPDHVTAAGFGKANPVSDNTTAAGRKLNRRVEMVVSGDVIGTEVTPNANAVPATPANQ
jgi:outer membrane protein OmpA-like peptidoglycan-associated protein